MAKLRCAIHKPCGCNGLKIQRRIYTKPRCLIARFDIQQHLPCEPNEDIKAKSLNVVFYILRSFYGLDKGKFVQANTV